MLRCNNVAWAWPNEYNIMQHPKMLHEKFEHFQTWSNTIQHAATYCNWAAKHVQHVVLCCVEMLRAFGRALTNLPSFFFESFQGHYDNYHSEENLAQPVNINFFFKSMEIYKIKLPPLTRRRNEDQTRERGGNRAQVFHDCFTCPGWPIQKLCAGIQRGPV